MSFDPVLVWFVVGLALVLLEFLAPGVILIFFGFGSWLTCLTTWAGLTTGLTSQLLTFAVGSLVLLILLRRWLKIRFFGHVSGDQKPEDNIDEFAGQIVSVTTDLGPDINDGKVEFKGAAWSARSAVALPSGTKAVIESVEGITLVVKPH